MPARLVVSLLICLTFRLMAEPNLTPQQQRLNVQSFDVVWQTVHDRHWDPKLGGIDWDGAKRELRPKVENATTMEQARGAMQDLLARLRQSHFSIIPVDVYSSLDAEVGGVAREGATGIDVRLVNGDVMVTSIDLGSPADKAGVRPGWVIVKIKGGELKPVVEKVMAVERNRNYLQLMVTHVILARLSAHVGETISVEFLDGSDQRVEKTLGHIAAKGHLSGFGNLPPQRVWIESKRLTNNGGGVTGYVRFNMFLDPGNLMPVFNEAVSSCLRCQGFIVDVRGNPGGIGLMATGMAGWFIEQQDQLLGTMFMRDNTLKFVVNPRAETFTGPLAILVDGGSASTSEIFAGGLKDLARARVFGEHTAAAALPSMIDQLPNGDGFQYAVANYISEGGKPLEGIGVIPDVLAPPTRKALLEGKDPALDEALAWIASKKARTAAVQ